MIIQNFPKPLFVDEMPNDLHMPRPGLEDIIAAQSHEEALRGHLLHEDTMPIFHLVKEVLRGRYDILLSRESLAQLTEEVLHLASERRVVITNPLRTLVHLFVLLEITA
ncbi:MAG: hypothetical protein FWC67_03545 [Defluviitaleaceae bacterium]|nr:hypothetical protein [Defluviitaleaceae bacterium]